MNNQSSRIAYWDNVKAILIFLVVLGHFLLPVHSDRGRFVNSIYTWIYLFHMPAFVFVSGYFSKSFVHNGANDIRKIIGFLALYILYSLPHIITTKDISCLFSPSSAQWYLLCMALWYVFIPYCAKIKPIPMLIISIIIGILIGTNNSVGSFLSLSRCIVFFPFFLAGYSFDGNAIRHRKPWIKRISVMVLFLALLCTFLFPDFFDKHSSVLYAESAYTSVLSGMLERIIWYIITSTLVITFLCVVTRKQLFFTFIGQRTLSIYVLHRPIRGVCRYLGVYDHLSSEIQVIVFCFIISVLLVFILSEKHITILLNKAFTANYRLLLR